MGAKELKTLIHGSGVVAAGSRPDGVTGTCPASRPSPPLQASALPSPLLSLGPVAFADGADQP
ncbi:hypothetical protein E2C01_027071 [Portunus trituberculatus]|uniref:Uncharacterized protein n=1 Tax=Portunus trituberculatus TaxID=210409 RepID=A0A5B7EHU1_PORTR|nr:hypothetical protein [Portunus trituberculatus]